MKELNELSGIERVLAIIAIVLVVLFGLSFAIGLLVFVWRFMSMWWSIGMLVLGSLAVPVLWSVSSK